MATTLVSTDSRGRIPLTKLVDTVEDHYLVRVSDDGVVTLFPAVVRAKSVDALLAVDPTIPERVAKQIDDGRAGRPSETWEKIRVSLPASPSDET